jgi:hypothetical protein
LVILIRVPDIEITPNILLRNKFENIMTVKILKLEKVLNISKNNRLFNENFNFKLIQFQSIVNL